MSSKQMQGTVNKKQRENLYSAHFNNYWFVHVCV